MSWRSWVLSILLDIAVIALIVLLERWWSDPWQQTLLLISLWVGGRYSAGFQL